MGFFSRRSKPLPEVPGDWKYQLGEWGLQVQQMPLTFRDVYPDISDIKAWGLATARAAVAEYGQDGPVSVEQFAAQLAGLAAVSKKFRPNLLYADVEYAGQGVTAEYWLYASPPRGERSLERLIDFKSTDKKLVRPRVTEFVELPAGPALHVHEFIQYRFLENECVVEVDEYYILSPLVGDVIVHSLSWAWLAAGEYYTALSKRMADSLVVVPVKG